MRSTSHPHNHKNIRPANRGSALVMAIVLSVVVTSLVMMTAWTSTIMIQSTSGLMKQSRAQWVAEGALQRAYWRFKKDHTFRADPTATPASAAITGSDIIDSQTYTYSVTVATVTANSVLIVATTSNGDNQAVVHATATYTAAAYAVLATGGDMDTKNLSITGDVQTGGNYSSSGNGGITGNLTYANNISDTSSVSGTKTKAAFTAIDFTALGTTLQSAAGLTYTGNQSSRSFDFTAVAGANKVIYVNGNVSNPTFVGSGTLYVNGTLSVGGFGSAANPVNLVATQDITTGNNITMVGTLYTSKNWNRGKMNLTGMAYVGGISASNNGSSSITETAAPWFDPRTSSSTATFALSNFGGVAP